MSIETLTLFTDYPSGIEAVKIALANYAVYGEIELSEGIDRSEFAFGLPDERTIWGELMTILVTSVRYNANRPKAACLSLESSSSSSRLAAAMLYAIPIFLLSRHMCIGTIDPQKSVHVVVDVKDWRNLAIECISTHPPFDSSDIDKLWLSLTEE